MDIACLLLPRKTLEAAGERLRRPAVDVWEEELRRLEGIGAGVESSRLGESFFAVAGLLGIHGGDRDGVVAAARAALRLPASVGVAPTRLAAVLAAGAGEQVVPGDRLGEFLAPVPIAVLSSRLGLPLREGEALVETLRRLGVGTVGELAALPAGHVADRFGPVGLRALRLARGEDEPLRPRRPHEEVAAEIDLPEGTAGGLLERALELLVDRFLAAPARRGRTVLGLRLGALLADGGSWSVAQGLGRPSASAAAMRGLLAPRLEELPAPATLLRLRAAGLGPPAHEQMEISSASSTRARERRHRLGDAVSELRAAQGPEALLRVLPVDPGSRVPKRRAVLTPYR